MTWEEAVAYCEDLELAGFNDWTLPTITQLRALGRGCLDEPPICMLLEPDWLSLADAEECDSCTAFDGPGSGGCYWVDGLDAGGCDEFGGYWSTSIVEDYYTETHAWAWYFPMGYPLSGNKTIAIRARCVRPLD